MEKRTTRVLNNNIPSASVKSFEKSNRNGNHAKKLAGLEKLVEDLVAEQERISDQLDTFRREGKTKSVRFRELMGQKLFNSNVLNLFERYGLL